jgi:hypothetical protein
MSARTAPPEPQAETPQTPGLLTDLRSAGDASGALPEVAPVAPRRSVSPQTLILALVLTASAGSLYMMRRQGMRGGLHFDPVKSPDLENVKTKSSAEERRILADLARSTAIADAPAGKLDKNPFILVGEEAKPLPGIDPDAESRARAERDRAEREKQEQEIQDHLKNIILTSVMEGPTPVAYVSGKLIKVGDIIEDVFTVAQIHDRSIELIAGGRTYTVQMSDGAAQGGMRGPGRPRGVPGIPASLR